MSIKNRINILEETLEQKTKTQNWSKLDYVIIGTQKQVDAQLAGLKKQGRLNNVGYEPLVIVLED